MTNLRLEFHDVIGFKPEHSHVHTWGAHAPDNVNIWASLLVTIATQTPHMARHETQVRFYFDKVEQLKSFTDQLRNASEQIMEWVDEGLAREQKLNAEAKPSED